MVLGITWLETGVASLLIILRAKNASILPRQWGPSIGLTGIYRLRWDFVWVVIAFVGHCGIRFEIMFAFRIIP